MIKFKNREALEAWIRADYEELWPSALIVAYADVLSERAALFGLRYGSDWSSAVNGETRFRNDFDDAFDRAYPHWDGGYLSGRQSHPWSAPGWGLARERAATRAG